MHLVKCESYAGLSLEEAQRRLIAEAVLRIPCVHRCGWPGCKWWACRGDSLCGEHGRVLAAWAFMLQEKPGTLLRRA